MYLLWENHLDPINGYPSNGNYTSTTLIPTWKLKIFPVIYMHGYSESSPIQHLFWQKFWALTEVLDYQVSFVHERLYSGIPLQQTPLGKYNICPFNTKRCL